MFITKVNVMGPKKLKILGLPGKARHVSICQITIIIDIVIRLDLKFIQSIMKKKFILKSNSVIQKKIFFYK